MAENCEIRPAGADDLPSLLALYRQFIPDDPDVPTADAARHLERIAAYPGSAVLIAVTDGVVVATCTLIVIPNLTRGGAPYGLVENVVTDAGHRRRGHGRAVIGHAVERAWEAGCYKVMLMTGSSDPGTLAFYGDIGFEQSKTGFQMRRLARRPE